MAKPDQESTWSDLRVGIITFVALILLILGITFAGGDKGLFLQKSSMVKALLANVSGLKKGSPVTMGGMTVGKVSQSRLNSRISIALATEALSFSASTGLTR